MSEREIIIKALNLVRECLINIQYGSGDKNHGHIEDINECILELEALPPEAE